MVVVLLWLLCGGVMFAAHNDDIVTLLNGDELHGEVKAMSRGKLSFKTSATGTIDIEWDEVLRLQSTLFFEIELQSGELYYGSIPRASAELMCNIDGRLEVVLIEIVEITPIKQGFWKRLDGSLTSGLSYTKGSDVGQFNFGADATYRTKADLYRVDLSSIITSSPDSGTSDREDFTFTYAHTLQHRYFAGANASAQRNDELGIDIRLIGGGNAGRMLIHSNRQLLLTSGGMAASAERPTSVDNREQIADADRPDGTLISLEAVGNVRYEYFDYDTPKTDFVVDISIYPSITEWGRFRVDADISLRKEIVTDFFWEASGYYTYDSQPPASANSGLDFGIVMSLGWSF